MSDKDDEYFDTYTKKRQLLGLFKSFLKEQGIVAQYTMPGLPS